MLRTGKQEDILRIQNSFWDKSISYFTWGNGSMDMMLPNITRAQLVVLAGSQGSGKTTWSIEMAKQNALKGKKEGFTCAYLSLEMDPERIIKRAVERTLKISKEDRRVGTMFDFEGLEEKKQESLEQIKAFIDTGLLVFPENDNDEALATLEGIHALCNQSQGPSLLFIDNLAEIEASGIKDEYMRIDHIMRELHNTTRTTDTTIVLLHHMAKQKMGEPLTINSIKGNNIVVTKPDVVVAIDKHSASNFNWVCKWKNTKNELIDPLIIKKFRSFAPRLDVRSVHIFKDRDYNMSGVAGYMRLVDGQIELLDSHGMKEEYPLIPDQQVKLAATLEKYGLIAIDGGGKEVLNEAHLPWD